MLAVQLAHGIVATRSFLHRLSCPDRDVFADDSFGTFSVTRCACPYRAFSLCLDLMRSIGLNYEEQFGFEM